MPSRDPFPTHHRIFFSIIEPALTICGALWAVVAPADYHSKLIPSRFHPTPPAGLTPVATVMAIRQLGSCFGLLAMVATILLPTLTRVLHRPERYNDLREILRAYLLALAIADLTHIGFTVLDLGIANSLDFEHYNSLVFGNTGLVVGLFTWRMWWFLGAGKRDKKVAARKGGKVKMK